jgi:hypothetical protein
MTSLDKHVLARGIMRRNFKQEGKAYKFFLNPNFYMRLQKQLHLTSICLFLVSCREISSKKTRPTSFSKSKLLLHGVAK